MDKKLIGLLVAAAIGLSACGSTGAVRDGKAEGHALGESSGSSSSSSNNSSGSSGNSGSNTNTDTGVATNVPVVFEGAGRSISSTNFFDVNGENTQPDANYLAPSSEKEINVLQVEGRKITLVPSEQAGNKTWYEASDKALYTGGTAQGSWAVVGNQLTHSKFGEVYDKDEKHHRFAQGNKTPQTAMPTTGVVKYTGHSTYSSVGTIGIPPIKGLSEFEVNFGENTLDGKIMPAKAGDFETLNLKAVIIGNNVEGYNTRLNNSQSAIVKGAFYGPNADELAGTYHFSADGTMDGTPTTIDGKKPMGTFGASKQ